MRSVYLLQLLGIGKYPQCVVGIWVYSVAKKNVYFYLVDTTKYQRVVSIMAFPTACSQCFCIYPKHMVLCFILFFFHNFYKHGLFYKICITTLFYYNNGLSSTKTRKSIKRYRIKNSNKTVNKNFQILFILTYSIFVTFRITFKFFLA